MHKPELGKKVIVTTDWSDYLATFAPNVQRVRTIRGKVVASEHYDDPATFRIHTGDSKFPYAVVPLTSRTVVEYDDGTSEQFNDVKPNSQTWEVSGSSGKLYHVTVSDNKWSCTCPGFGFRHNCKHIKDMKQELIGN